MSARVLVVGSGAREHTLAWGLSRSSAVDEVICAPGNAGMATIGECVDVVATDPGAVADLTTKLDPDLVVVGPEDPLAAGVVDAVEATGRPAFGPNKAAAQLEGSKAFLKDVLVAANVPTARYAAFGEHDLDAAHAYLDTMSDLYVIKTSGLAAGKGVIVTPSLSEAKEAVRAYLSGEAFGDAGRTLIIEEGMTGPELSIFALCDGTAAQFIGIAQDHKRAFDNDEGANTGGMGAYSPVPFVDGGLVDEVFEIAIRPTLAEMSRRGTPFRGALYCGLMLTPDGVKVIEYNVRFGDPECQVLIPRLRSDLYAHLYESAQGSLSTPIEFNDGASVGVVMASEGYPPAPLRKGDVITGLDAAAAHDNVVVFHAATATDADGNTVTNGGHVLCVSALGADVADARKKAYAATAEISWPGVHYRRDIAAQALT